jgi:hypothetical protein
MVLALFLRPREHIATIEVGEGCGIRVRENGMPSYQVEEIFAGKVIISHKIVAPTPFRAAKLATNRDVTLRNSEVRWIRVFEEDRRHRAYEYTVIERPQFVSRGGR